MNNHKCFHVITEFLTSWELHRLRHAPTRLGVGARHSRSLFITNNLALGSAGRKPHDDGEMGSYSGVMMGILGRDRACAIHNGT
jgi:hypothetical protein